MIAASLALGQTLRERGAHDEAITILAQTVEHLAATGSVPMDQAAALSELAKAHYAAGHYDDSASIYRDVLQRHRAIVGNAHPLVAGDIASLAAIEQDLGYYDKAEMLAREALAINERYYGVESPHTADNLTSLGRALLYQLAVQESAVGSSHPLVAEAVNELGNILAMQDRFAEAAANFQRSADIYRNVHGDRHYFVAIALSNVAYMQMKQGDYDKAEALFRPESLAGYEILAAQASPSISFLRAARDDLVLIYEATGQTEKAAGFRQEIAALDNDATH